MTVLKLALFVIFPPDMDETRKKQFAFQSELWGGPERYTPWRGFRLCDEGICLLRFMKQMQRSGWLVCDCSASAMPENVRPPFIKKMELIAHAMVNQVGDRSVAG